MASDKEEMYRLTFKGDRNKWRKWRLKFTAFTKRKECYKALETDLSTTTDAKELLMNDKAVGYMTSFLDGMIFDEVTLASEDNAYTMWQYLREKFELVDALDMEEKKLELDEIKTELRWDPKTKPSDFYTEIGLLNEKYITLDKEKQMSESEKKTLFLTRLPPDDEYQRTKEIIMENGLFNSSLDSIVKKMDKKWEKMYGTDGAKKKKDSGIALNTESDDAKKNNWSNKRFDKNKNKNNDGKSCRYCGKKGHIEKDCRGKERDLEASKKLGKQVHTNRICYNCQTQGHISKDCPKKKKGGESNNTTFEDIFVGMTMHQEVDRDSKEAFDNLFDNFSNNEAEDIWCMECNEDTDGPDWNAILDISDEYDDSSDAESMPGLISQNDDDSDSSDEESIDGRNENDWELEPMAPTNYTNSKDVAESFAASAADYDYWLIDSGATLSIDNNDENLHNITNCHTEIIVGTGAKTTSRKQGFRQLSVNAKDESNGQEKSMKIKIKVKFAPTFSKKILSMKQLTDLGWDVMFTTAKAYLRKQEDPSIMIPLEVGEDGMNYLKVSKKEVVNLAVVEDEAWKDTPQEDLDKDNQPIPILRKQPKWSQNTNKIDINLAHAMWGHKSDALLKKIAKNYNMTLIGTMESCEGCGLAMAKRKAIAKTTLVAAKKFGVRLFGDTAGPYTETLGGNKYIFSIVDDFSRYGWIGFGTRKTQFVTFVQSIIELLKGKGHKVTYFRCDNAGENSKAISTVLEKEGITPELTPPHSPEYNGVVEQRLTVLPRRGLASMVSAGLNEETRKIIWAESVSYHNFTENITVSTRRSEASATHFNTDDLKWIPFLQPFGRIGIVTTRQKFRSKWKEKGVKMICTGYALNHPRGTYRMFDPVKKSICCSQDIFWHDWSPYNPKSDLSIFIQDPTLKAVTNGLDDNAPTREPSKQPNIIPDDEDDDDTSDGNKEPTISQAPILNPEPATGRQAATVIPTEIEAGRQEQQQLLNSSPSTQEANDSNTANQEKERKLEREMRKLECSYNPKTSMRSHEIEVDDEHGGTELANMNFLFNYEKETEAWVMTVKTDKGTLIIRDPDTVNEAMNTDRWEEWKKGIKAEAYNFEKRQSWKRRLRHKILQMGRKIVKCKTIFKTKIETDLSYRFKVRFTMKGYMLQAGVDYKETFSPVATETSTRMVILIYLYGVDGLPEAPDIIYVIDMIDIEAAFLEGDLPKPVYIEFPPGLLEAGLITEEEAKNECIELTGGMYGSPESALQFFNAYINHLKKHGYKQSRMDPSVVYKKDARDRTVLIAVIHVDDTLLVGTKEEIQIFKDTIKTRFGYTDKDGFKKHLGIWYERDVDEEGNKCMIARMDDNINNIISTFELHTKQKVREFGTPGTPGLSMKKNEGEPIEAALYRKLVGKLMYLVCKLMPEAGNAARELARHFANPGKQQWKELARFIGYLKKNRKDIKLTYRKPKDMRVGVMADSNYATNEDDRKSVSGGLQTLGGSLCNWFSKSQSMVTRSSTEAEYVSAVLNASELKFMQMFLEEVFFCNTPGIMLEDNMGCIFLIRNKQMGPRTKAIQVRMHWIREAHEKEELLAGHVNSEQNESDILTKNVEEKLQSKFSQRLRNGKLRLYVQWKAIIQSIDGVEGKDSIGEAVEQYEPTTDGRSYHTEDIQVYTTTCKGRVIREMYYLMESPK